MEETNFHRAPTTSIEPDADIECENISANEKAHSGPASSEKTATPSVDRNVEAASSLEPLDRKKSYWQKLAIFQVDSFQRKANFKGMILRPLIFFSFPVISFSGFMYGAIVCYFNILNGTASVILSSPPYNFSGSKVGLSYVSCLIGVFIG
jgi:hypothetical protein